MSTESRYPLPPQHDTAMKHVRRKVAEDKVDKIDSILHHVDSQIFNNLSHRSYDEHPGSIFPYTTITFSSHPFKDDFRKPTHQIIEIGVQGFATPPDGHPVAPEKIYDRVFTHMADARRKNLPTEVTIAKLGQPSGMGGHVTKEFNKAKKEEGFSLEGKILASLASELLPKDESKRKNTTVIFHGTSMGAIKALEAAIRFDEPDVKKEAHLIKPPRIPGLSAKFQPTSLQILAGFAVEGIVKKRMKSLKQEMVTPQYQEDVRNIFREKELSPTDSFIQRLRKEKAVYQNVRNIMKNKIHKNEDFDFPVKIQVGAIDPINFSLGSLENALLNQTISKGNIQVEFSMSTHTTNYYLVEKWADAVPSVNTSQTVTTFNREATLDTSLKTENDLVPVLK